MGMQADVKRAPEHIAHEQFEIAQVLDFRPIRGIIRLHEQRVVILRLLRPARFARISTFALARS
jgi:hypothetical protein